jgi:CubicO group peptidase (beta-lactamase class C family)
VVPSAAAALDFTAVDATARDYMQRSGVGAGQLAITRHGVLQLSRSYATRPPQGYSPVNTLTLFRIASCSKMFTCAAIGSLRASGKLDMDAKVFPLLGIKSPAISRDKPDPRIDEITVQQLVDHAGGWNDHESFNAKDGTHIPGTEWDPVFSVREISIKLGLSSPPSKLDIARYMYGKPLQFAPGSQNFNTTDKKSYSNFGYVLLGLVIESVAGQSYIDFVRTGIGPDTDTSNVYLSRMLDNTRNPREVWYLDPGSGLTVLQPRSDAWAPSAYGGGGFLTELMDSAGGIMTNAETLARFSSRHAVWGVGGRAPRSGRSGSMPGTSSFTYCRPNGIDCAFILNTRTFSGGPKMLEDFISMLESELDKL